MYMDKNGCQRCLYHQSKRKQMIGSVYYFVTDMTVIYRRSLFSIALKITSFYFFYLHIHRIYFSLSMFESSFILQSTPDSKLLRAANAEINAAAMKKEFWTPHQKYVSNLMKAFERMTIDKGLLKEELEVQGKVITARAE